MAQRSTMRTAIKVAIFVIVMAFLGILLNGHFLPALINENNWLAFYSAILLGTAYVLAWVIGVMWLFNTVNKVNKVNKK